MTSKQSWRYYARCWTLYVLIVFSALFVLNAHPIHRQSSITRLRGRFHMIMSCGKTPNRSWSYIACSFFLCFFCIQYQKMDEARLQRITIVTTSGDYTGLKTFSSSLTEWPGFWISQYDAFTYKFRDYTSTDSEIIDASHKLLSPRQPALGEMGAGDAYPFLGGSAMQ